MPTVEGIEGLRPHPPIVNKMYTLPYRLWDSLPAQSARARWLKLAVTIHTKEVFTRVMMLAHRHVLSLQERLEAPDYKYRCGEGFLGRASHTLAMYEQLCAWKVCENAHCRDGLLPPWHTMIGDGQFNVCDGCRRRLSRSCRGCAAAAERVGEDRASGMVLRSGRTLNLCTFRSLSLCRCSADTSHD